MNHAHHRPDQVDTVVLGAGLFWLAGQGGYGIQSADGAARMAAALLLGRPLPDDLLQIELNLPALLGPARCRA